MAHVVTREFTGFNFPNSAKSFLTPQSKSMVGFQRTKPSYEEGYYLDQDITTASAINALEESMKLNFSLPQVEGTKFNIINDTSTGKSEKKEIKRKNGKFEVTIQPQGGFIITN